MHHRLCLCDGANYLDCGVRVVFRRGIPVSFDGVQDEFQLQSAVVELKSWGFRRFKVDKYCYSILFDEAIEDELIRIGVHASTMDDEKSISLEIDSNGHDVILYDNESKIILSPLKAMKILEKMPFGMSLKDFWASFTEFQEENWISRFRRIRDKNLRVRVVSEAYGRAQMIDPQVANVVLTVYDSLSAWERKAFEVFSCNDPGMMHFVANKMQACA